MNGVWWILIYRNRHALGEIAGSLSMLTVMILLLAGSSFIAIQSIKNTSTMIEGRMENITRQVGQAIKILLIFSNKTGRYVYIYNYGWEAALLTKVYMDGKNPEWSITCNPIAPRMVCVLSIPTGQRSILTIVFGDYSIEVSI